MKRILLSTTLITAVSAQTLNIDLIQIEDTAIPSGTQLISVQEIQKTRAINLQDTLQRDVSFNTIADGKGEEGISFRGLDHKNTQYIEDGIPLYRTTAGFVDTRFTMTDAAIELNDGSSTSSLGVSPMGGEVVIQQTTPKKDFETNIGATISTNDEYYNASAGSAFGDSYIKANLGYYHRSNYKLSKDFTPTAVQNTRTRINSDKEQKNFSIKAGTDLNNNLHVAAKVSVSLAQYGLEPNTQTNVQSPKWDAYSRIDKKDLYSYYLYADYEINGYDLSARVYKDNYEDQWVIYKEPQYITKDPVTTYDDSRIGTILKADKTFQAHKSTLLFQIEQNEHIRKGGGFATEEFTLDTYALSYMYNYAINKNVKLEAGVSATKLSSSNALISDKNGVAAQTKLSYTNDYGIVHVSIAKKNRMPTTEEMSTFFPWQVANPNIKPEQSMQYALGYEKDLGDKTSVEISGYYYKIQDLIVNLSNSFTNVNKATHYGAELRFNTQEFQDNNIALSYAYTHAKDSSNQRIQHIPYNQLKLEDTIKLSKNINGYIAYQYFGSRYSQNSATYTSEYMKMSEYHLAEVQLAYKVSKSIDTNIGIKNLLDENYEWSYAYPAQGRYYYLSFQYKI